MFKNTALLLFGLFLCLGGLTYSYPVPPLTGPVYDEEGLLSSSEKQQLDILLRHANSRGVAQVQVAIIKSLQGEPIESVSIQMTDKWKLGNAKQDNGILFLLAIQDKKMRIEVGQGLEGSLPDMKTKKILEEVVRPFFRQGDMSRGVWAGTIAILKAVDGEYADMEGPQKSDKGNDSWLFLIYVVLFILVMISRVAGGGRRSLRGGRGWGSGGPWGGGGGWGGGSGGGGWSGGGGGFSGGGASSGW